MVRLVRDSTGHTTFRSKRIVDEQQQHLVTLVLLMLESNLYVLQIHSYFATDFVSTCLDNENCSHLIVRVMFPTKLSIQDDSLYCALALFVMGPVAVEENQGD